MDEMTQLAQLRSEVPTPAPEDLRAEEERLMAAIAGTRSTRRPVRLFVAALAGAAALTAGAVTVLDDEPRPVPRMMPAGSVRVLDRAAAHAGNQPELHPRPGQFLRFESQTMDTAESNSRQGHVRYLARSRRTVWSPVQGTAVDGAVRETVLPARPYPGWPLPPEAPRKAVRGKPEKLADFDRTAPHLRTDYAHLSRLPTDPQGMYRHLYTGLGTGAQDDIDAWGRVIDMLRESYMPAAQRAALFRAAGAIPGVTTVGNAVDAVGRPGIAAAKVIPALGVREECIFDAETYRYLGQRTVVVDAAKAKAPVGGVLSSSALLKVTVTDDLPRLED